MTGAKTEYLKGDESDQTEIARYRIILIIYEKIPNQTKNGRKSDDGDKTARNEKSGIIKKYNKICLCTANILIFTKMRVEKYSMTSLQSAVFCLGF